MFNLNGSNLAKAKKLASRLGLGGDGDGGSGGSDFSLATFRANHRVAFFRCEELSGDLVDSENGNDAAPFGTPTYGATGVAGNCIDLDTTGDYFRVQTDDIMPSDTEDLAISFQWKPDGSARRNMFMFSASSSGGTPNIFIQQNGTDRFRVGANNTQVATEFTGSGINVNDGNFHHCLVTVIRNGIGQATFSCYLDGILVCRSAFTNTNSLKGGYFFIGRITGDSLATGLYDEIEVFRASELDIPQALIDEMVAQYGS